MARSTSKPSASLPLPKKVLTPDQIERDIVRLTLGVYERAHRAGKIRRPCSDSRKSEIAAVVVGSDQMFKRCFLPG